MNPSSKIHLKWYTLFEKQTRLSLKEWERVANWFQVICPTTTENRKTDCFPYTCIMNISLQLALILQLLLLSICDCFRMLSDPTRFFRFGTINRHNVQYNSVVDSSMTIPSFSLNLQNMESDRSGKLGVLLLNLGGPESTEVYLFNDAVVVFISV